MDWRMIVASIVLAVAVSMIVFAPWIGRLLCLTFNVNPGVC